MDTFVRIMQTPYVGPGIVLAISMIAAWAMVYFQHRNHPEDFDD
jgi:hypothetical protein